MNKTKYIILSKEKIYFNTPNPKVVFKVDFEQSLTVKAIATKGSESAEEYVMKYVVKYKNTTSSWITVTNGISRVSHTCIMLISKYRIRQFARPLIYLHFPLQVRHTFRFVSTI